MELDECHKLISQLKSKIQAYESSKHETDTGASSEQQHLDV
jgi:hypothetical protein